MSDYKYNPNKTRKVQLFPTDHPDIPADALARQMETFGPASSNFLLPPLPPPTLIPVPMSTGPIASTPASAKKPFSRSTLRMPVDNARSSGASAGRSRLSKSTTTLPGKSNFAGDIPVPAIPDQFSPIKSTFVGSSLKTTERLTTPGTPIVEASLTPGQGESKNTLRQTVRKGFPTLSTPTLPVLPMPKPGALPALPPMPSPLPGLSTPSAMNKASSQLEAVAASFSTPSRAYTAALGGRRTGSPIKNVRSLPASVKTFSIPSQAQTHGQRRPPSVNYAARPGAVTPSRQTAERMQMGMSATMPRYQQATAASLAKSTSAASPPKSHQRKLTGGTPRQRMSSQSDWHNVQQFVPGDSYSLPAMPHRQFDRFPELRSPKPILGQSYQTVDQLLSSIGVSSSPEEPVGAGQSGREASEFFNQNHSLAWLPGGTGMVDDTYQSPVTAHQQQSWHGFTPVNASLVPDVHTSAAHQTPSSQPMLRTDSSAARTSHSQSTSRLSTLPPPPATPVTASSVGAEGGREASAPASGLMDGIVVNGIHYHVQNTEALLEDIRSGRLGGVVEPVSAGPTADGQDGFLLSRKDDVLFNGEDWQHQAEYSHLLPVTPTSAFLKLGSASGHQYLLASSSSGPRNFFSSFQRQSPLYPRNSSKQYCPSSDGR